MTSAPLPVLNPEAVELLRWTAKTGRRMPTNQARAVLGHIAAQDECIAALEANRDALRADRDKANEALLPALVTSWPEDVITMRVQHKRIAALEARVAELEGDHAKLTSGCPFDGRPRETAHLEPTDPCPVCGDLGVFEDVQPSRCVSNAASRREWAPPGPTP